MLRANIWAAPPSEPAGSPLIFGQPGSPRGSPLLANTLIPCPQSHPLLPLPTLHGACVSNLLCFELIISYLMVMRWMVFNENWCRAWLEFNIGAWKGKIQK